jgi:hypothetical protein
MLFLEAFCLGFALTLGVEVALGLCFAIGKVAKGNGRK